MKELLLIRHAKSSWEFSNLRDEDRPLNKRGHRDAPFMAEHLRKMGIIPTHLISSPANRAYSTAEYFHQEFEPEDVRIWKETELYFCTEEDFLNIIQATPEEIELPAFFSHNPVMTYFANRFTDNWIDNVPTCGIIHLQSSADNWSDFYFDNSIIRNIFFPKRVKRGE